MATPPWPDFDKMNNLETQAHTDALGIILGQGAKQFQRRRFLKDFKYIFMLFFEPPCGHTPWPDCNDMNKLETHAPRDASCIILGQGTKRFQRRFLKDFKYIFMLFF